MGMFDYVRVEVPLPDGWEGPMLLQTKDFDCMMETFEIRQDGTLWVERGTVSKRQWQQVEFHGWIHFYGYERIRPAANPPYFDPSEHRWHEYKAKFTDGVLVEIVLDDPF